MCPARRFHTSVRVGACLSESMGLMLWLTLVGFKWLLLAAVAVLGVGKAGAWLASRIVNVLAPGEERIAISQNIPSG